jgi:hypothetical protein
MLCFVDGMMGYLSRVGVLLKDFGEHAQAMTGRLIEASLATAQEARRPVNYLQSPNTRKDEYARNIALKDDIQSGLICVLTCVEPCKTYEVYRNRDKKILELKPRIRKCKFLYHYWIDPRFGFMSARIQSWFPFSIQVCINGRQWLSRRLDEAGLPYDRYENGFPWIDDFAKAQMIMDRMHQINWPRMLDVVARRLNPAHGRMFRGLGMSYYWSAFQTEWATDIAFPSPHALAKIYPQLVRGALATFGSRDVLRFLGKRPDRRYQGQLLSDYKDRPEGVRFCGSKRRSTSPARSSRIVRLKATRTARRRGVRCAKAWPTCTAAPRCLSSRTIVTPTRWLRSTRPRRLASWRPRCVVRCERTAHATAPCGHGPSPTGNFWSRSATANSWLQDSAIAIWLGNFIRLRTATRPTVLGSPRKCPTVFASFERTA